MSRVSPPSLDKLREHGFALHERGEFDEAADAYREVLRCHPGDVEVMQALGALAIQTGRYAEALELLVPVVHVRPTADTHSDLGNALLGLARFEEALASYDRAIALDPARPATHLNRGNVLRALARHAEALLCFDTAIALWPQFLEAHVSRGVALLELQRWDEALAACDRVLERAPDLVPVLIIRGTALLSLGLAGDALRSYERALALQPDSAQAHMGRGRSQKELGQRHLALSSYERAIELDRDYADAYCNRGNVLQELDQWEAALTSYERAIALKPRFAEAHSSRGTVLHALGRLEAAQESYARAIAIDPTFARAHLNRAMAWLLAGDFRRGWAELEWRGRAEHRSSVRKQFGSAQPWLGQASLAGKTILLYGEWGLGDTIQFCRYVRLVAERGARVVLTVPVALSGLLSSLQGVNELIVEGGALPALDYYCSLLSLPLAFQTTLATLPAAVPYLACSAARLQRWRLKLGERRKPRVGLVWSGGFRPSQLALWAVNNRRNIPLALLEPLAHPDVEFYSLQKGEPGESELAQLRARHWQGPSLTDYTSELQDFADTAALIEQLDLVISVDTSTAHLAGALGKPVWILNRFDTCWRWLLDRSDSPWYPSATLYRQERPNDWAGVVRRVRTDLERIVAGGTAICR